MKPSSATEFVKDNVSKVHSVGEEYRGRLESLANSTKESASKAFGEAEAIGTVKLDEYREGAISLAESVQEAGTRSAQIFHDRGMAPALRVFREGSSKLTENVVSSLKSMSINRLKRARTCPCLTISPLLVSLS